MPASIERREICLRCFARWLDPRGLFDATRQDVELFLDGRQNPGGAQDHPPDAAASGSSISMVSINGP